MSYQLRGGEPCEHPGCLSHVTHPCEGCGRTAGRALPYLGPWCCEEGERLGVTICPECAEMSAAYQSCLGPGPQIIGTDFVFFIHPDMEYDIRNMLARDKWAKAYRLWRHAGKPEATPQQILAGDYTSEPFPFDEYAEFEMGAWEGIRAITAN